MPLLLRNRWIWISLGIIVLVVYFIFDPSEYIWMPQCVFHRVTGLQCMGCGSQRMVHSLLHGHIREAIQANALIFFSLPFILFLIFVEFNRTRYPNLYKNIHSKGVIIGATAVLIIWLLLRNILGI